MNLHRRHRRMRTTTPTTIQMGMRMEQIRIQQAIIMEIFLEMLGQTIQRIVIQLVLTIIDPMEQHVRI